MNIIEIYKKYKIPDNLQMHMLRVAACGNLILDNWIGEKINKNSIIRILLLHDMGNIVKITPEQNSNSKFLEFRKSYIDKYGNDDHKITNVISKNEGLTQQEIDIMDSKILKNNELTAQSDSYEIKICAYCDQRVAPNGVVDIKDRLEELRSRHQKNGKGSMSNEETANKLIFSALEIEKQIMQKCTIKPNDINDASVDTYINKLREYEIKNKQIEER